MAIAGLHGVSVLDPSFIRGSQSQTSRQLGNEGRASTQASSLLRMWRRLEDEHAASHSQERVGERFLQQRNDALISDHSRGDPVESDCRENMGASENVSCMGENDSETWSEGQIGSQNEDEDPSDIHYEHRCDFGEIERGRVRQIFREWTNSGVRECSPSDSFVNNTSRSEWLGETEQERVRIIREWVQSNNRQIDSCGDVRGDQGSGISAQIDQVRDGSVINQNEARNGHSRRGIRRLCGRQAVIDMIKKAEIERQREIQGLLEQQAVSHFPHRNRIQSLLKSRFLRNDRLVENERLASVAEGELGLLRQRHTVSGLREGFFSSLYNSAHRQASSDLSDTMSEANDGSVREQNLASSNHSDTRSETNGSVAEHNGTSSSNVVEVLHGQSLLINPKNHNQEGNCSGPPHGGHDLEDRFVEDRPESAHELERWQEQVLHSEVRDGQLSESVELIGRRDYARQNVDRTFHETTINTSLETIQIEAEEHVDRQDELINEWSEQSNEEHVLHELPDGTNNLEGIVLGTTDSQGSSAEAEQVLRNELSDWQGSGEYNGWGEQSILESMGDNQLESTSFDWAQEFLAQENREDTHLRNTAEDWNEQDSFRDTSPNWITRPSNQTAVPERLNPIYFPDDDDNSYSMDIRELLQRRSVSNLLNSGFRESLDQVMQSYVERQGRNSGDREELYDTVPPSASVTLDLDRQSGDQNSLRDAVESTPLILPSSQVPPSQPFWDQELQNDMHQRFGIDWEIFNDLRIDMDRLQHRMNNLQKMLEACMDMQLELQRSIRQEVAAALNRSASSEGLSEDCLGNDGSKWDHVRKGICCICCTSNIDSLLCRCGHMCTCSNCANRLVQVGGKCPMCRAPVIELIRAYSI